MAGAAPLFPVVLKDGVSAPPPGADTYYVLAGNGLFLERTTPLYRATVPVAGVPGLPAETAHLELRIPRVPRSLLERAVGFFRAVWRQCEGEAMLALFLDPVEGRIVADAPLQVIPYHLDRGRLRPALCLGYATCPKPQPRFLRLGSFHSHGPFAPEHSGIDRDDERDETGLHLTAGHLDRDRPEFAAAFVVAGYRFPLASGDVLPRFHGPRRPPDAWLERVRLTRLSETRPVRSDGRP
jgi:hypothetical protein